MFEDFQAIRYVLVGLLLLLLGLVLLPVLNCNVSYFTSVNFLVICFYLLVFFFYI